MINRVILRVGREFSARFRVVGRTRRYPVVDSARFGSAGCRFLSDFQRWTSTGSVLMRHPDHVPSYAAPCAAPGTQVSTRADSRLATLGSACRALSFVARTPICRDSSVSTTSLLEPASIDPYADLAIMQTKIHPRQPRCENPAAMRSARSPRLRIISVLVELRGADIAESAIPTRGGLRAVVALRTGTAPDRFIPRGFNRENRLGLRSPELRGPSSDHHREIRGSRVGTPHNREVRIGVVMRSSA